MNRSLRGLVAGIALLATAAAGCVNHKKSADAAARAGNWKAAEAHYREAARKKPEDAELQRKHAEAKAKAFEQAMAMGKDCIAQANWPCAQGELDYAANLEPGNADAKSLAASARKSFAMDDLAKARGTVPAGNLVWGLDMVDHARSLTTDPGVMQQAQQVTGEIVNAMLSKASDLRKQAQAPGAQPIAFYDQALAMLDRAAKLDTRAGQMAAEIRGERARWVDTEYERLCKLGDAALQQSQWNVAVAQYGNAEALKAGGRGRNAGIYAKHIADGEVAAGSRNWVAATDLYRRAATMAEEALTRRYAATALDRVEVRPYRFRLTGVLVNPLRPNGQPWAEGATNRAGTSTSRSSAHVPEPPSLRGKRGPDSRAAAKGYAARIPQNIRPTVVVEVTLPDGRVLRTQERKEAWAAFDSWFVLASNQFDQRPVLVRAKHRESNGTEVDLGTVSVPLGSILAGIPPEPAGSVIYTEIEADFPRTVADGAFGGFASVVPGRANEATDASSPTSTAAIGWRLARVDAGVKGTDAVAGAIPDIKVEVEQSGRLVFRSPAIKDSHDASWSPENVYLFATPSDQLIVRLYDADGNRVIYGGAAPAPGDRMTTVEVKTPAGSFTRLVFERRISGP